jgi:hypothetical protein
VAQPLSLGQESLNVGFDTLGFDLLTLVKVIRQAAGLVLTQCRSGKCDDPRQHNRDPLQHGSLLSCPPVLWEFARLLPFMPPWN